MWCACADLVQCVSSADTCSHVLIAFAALCFVPFAESRSLHPITSRARQAAVIHLKAATSAVGAKPMLARSHVLWLVVCGRQRGGSHASLVLTFRVPHALPSAWLVCSRVVMHCANFADSLAPMLVLLKRDHRAVGLQTWRNFASQ